MKKILSTFVLLLCGTVPLTTSAALTLPADFKAIDRPNDNGGAVVLMWGKLSDEGENIKVTALMSETPEGPYLEVETFPANAKFRSDLPSAFGFAKSNEEEHALEVRSVNLSVGEGEQAQIESKLIEPGKNYYFKLRLREGEQVVESPTPVVGQAYGNLFAWHKLNAFIISLFLMAVILFFINLAKRNPHLLFIRKIAGLDAMEDALGRATEMGKGALFVHGLRSISEVSTIAAINILGKIAKKIAEFDTGLKVANWDPVIQQVSRETVKEAYIEAGRPDAYREENIFFASSEQFSYAAAVEGIMVRERPAAIFHFGYFYAESLLLSETGASTGAIQIAGTDAFTQIPFFITTCDYTLMGEELYAASAYLSREPKLLGSLKGQDVGKLLIIVVLVLGTLFSTFGWDGFAQIFWPR